MDGRRDTDAASMEVAEVDVRMLYLLAVASFPAVASVARLS